MREAASTLGAKPRQLCPWEETGSPLARRVAGQDAVFSPEVWAVAWSLGRRHLPGFLGTGDAGRLASLPEVSVCSVTSLGALRRETPRSPHVCDARSPRTRVSVCSWKKADGGSSGRLEEVAFTLPLASKEQTVGSPGARGSQGTRAPLPALGTVPSKSHHATLLLSLLNDFGDKETQADPSDGSHRTVCGDVPKCPGPGGRGAVGVLGPFQLPFHRTRRTSSGSS